MMKIVGLLSVLVSCAISIANAKTSSCRKPEINLARKWKSQAKNVQKLIESLGKAEQNKEVFKSFGNLLGKLTNNGTYNCTQETKDANKFLSDCQTTAKASCQKDGLDLAMIKTNAIACESSVTCRNLPANCNLQSTLDELKKLRDEKCMNKDFAGSFKACMDLVKGKLGALISACLEVYCPDYEYEYEYEYTDY